MRSEAQNFGVDALCVRLERNRAGSGLPLINTNVINVIALREIVVVDSLRAAPGAPDRQVQDEVLVVVKRPGVRTAPFIAISEVLVVIHEEVQPSRIPFQSISVKGLRGIGNGNLASFAVLLNVVVFSGVNIGMNESRLKADELHNVDLAAGGPADLAAIGSESPDGRPRPTA